MIPCREEAASDRPPVLLAVVGPTGSGKTSLAIAAAKHLDTEIISADSMQFYRGMEIGTAAPTPEELAAVPHHFVAFLAPNETMAAGEYEPIARAEVARLNKQDRIAVVAGGSGLYISALIDGLFGGPTRNPEIRARLTAEAEEHGPAALMARLQKVDPDYAKSISSENDVVRVVRALEVYEISGQPFSKLHQEHRAQNPPLPAVQVALEWDRAELYARIERRVDQMIAAGWVDEVQRLLEDGHGPEINRLKALGYRELVAHIQGKQSLETAIVATKQHHRRYAKRQLTWFRSDKRIHWLPASEESATAELLEGVLDRLS